MSFSLGGGGISSASDVALSSPATDHALMYNGATGKWYNKALNIPFESFTFTYQGAVALATGSSRQYLGSTYTIDAVYAGINTAPTGASLVVDVKKNNVSIFSSVANRPTVVSGGHYNLTSTFATTSLVAGDYLTVDVTQIGSTVAGSDLTVTVRLKKS